MDAQREKVIEEGETSSPTLGHETGAERERNDGRRRERIKVGQGESG